MKRAAIITLALLVAGCAQERVPEDQPDQQEILEQIKQKNLRIEHLEADVQSLQEDLADLIKRHQQEVSRLKDTIAENDRDSRKSIQILENSLRERNREIKHLKKSLKAAQSRARDAEKQAAEAMAAMAPPPIKIITPNPDGKEADARVFPVQVYDVVGRRITTGTHMSTRYVETDETYRDEFGRTRNVSKPIDEIVEEFAYHVSFSVRNLTDTNVEMIVRAGVMTQDITVPAHAVLTDLSIEAALGSSLLVEVGSDRRTYEIPF